MASKQARFDTVLSVKQCADVFREGAARARGIGAMLGGMGAKVTGNDMSGFFTPRDDSPFSVLDEDKPDFMVGAFIPKFRAGAQGNGTAIHMYVWDRSKHRAVELYAPHGFGGGMHARKLISKVSEAFVTADPRCRPVDV